MPLPDYPFRSHFADVAGLRLHYLDEGPAHLQHDTAAPVVVMVHGNPSWSFYYRKLVLALRDRYRCIVPDHIGMGLSEKPIASGYPFTLDRRVADLDSLLSKTLAPEQPVHLIVHDWGGMIGCTWATRNLSRVRSLTALNTAGFGLPPGAAIPWQLHLARSPLGALLIQGGNAFCRGAVRSCVTRKAMPPEVAQGYLLPYNSWAHRLAVLRFVEDIPLEPGHPSWRTVQATTAALAGLSDKPMLLGWGMRDFVFTPAYLAEWRRRFPHAQVQQYDDAGHYVLEDAGAELIPAIGAFLEQVQ